jgi:hypothetical protein
LRKCMNLVRNLLQTDRTVIYRIHGRHVGKQRLTCADIAGSLLSSNMLFACYGYRISPQQNPCERIDRLCNANL